MLSIFKKLFNKPSEPEPPTSSAPALTTAPTVTHRTAPQQPPAAPPSADAIFITLKNVVFPDPIKKKMDKALSGAERIYISPAEALRQLPTGAVKIPFRDIVRMSPNTFLTADEEMLNTMISLPLGEILPRIKTLPRRSEQKKIEVPKDLDAVFGKDVQAKRDVEVAAPSNAVPTSLPPTPAPPIAAPRPVRPPVPAAEEKYVPPAPKPLAPEAPIKAALPDPSTLSPRAAAPAPAAVAPITPISPIAPGPALAPAPIPAPAPAPRVVATPSPPGVAVPARPAPAPSVPAPAATEAPTISLGEVFGQPDKKDWTPQEVVEKAAAMRGVAGAIITTADGLPVAFHLPEPLNGNVIGAFVPQMYTRITQYTRDLKLGDAKALTIIVDNVPLQLFKSGSIYFTALGKAGENLPKPQLTAIASALGRQS